MIGKMAYPSETAGIFQLAPSNPTNVIQRNQAEQHMMQMAAFVRGREQPSTFTSIGTLHPALSHWS